MYSNVFRLTKGKGMLKFPKIIKRRLRTQTVEIGND